MRERVAAYDRHPMAVPVWLRGAWSRCWIQRAVSVEEEGGIPVLGPPNESVQVLYVQTPWAFVDVRIPRVEGADGLMAFAGVTTVERTTVSWHACLHFPPEAGSPDECWRDADAGAPQPTKDIGVFSPVHDVGTATTWMEVDPDGTYAEKWERVGAGGVCVARRRGTALIVVAGGRFGFASETVFAAGRITPDGWVCDLSTDTTTHALNAVLVLPGSAAQWDAVLHGSDLVDWPVIDKGNTAAVQGMLTQCDLYLGRGRMCTFGLKWS
mmetsp:Transcript_54280/g.129355  ORF Transcript_54280/g.129355 Transcript_54280/m.129355 type:complete len:268 (+) Transcript_54280:291-1094(+)